MTNEMHMITKLFTNATCKLPTKNPKQGENNAVVQILIFTLEPHSDQRAGYK